MSKPDLFNEVRKIGIKQNDLKKATQIVYKMLKHTQVTPRLPLEYYGIGTNHRLRVIDNQNEYDSNKVEELLYNPLDRVIIYELAINGDCSRDHLRRTLESTYDILIPRTTIYEHLEKLISKNWVKNYHVSGGSGGAPPLFFFFNGIGEKCRIALSKNIRDRIRGKTLKW